MNIVRGAGALKEATQTKERKSVNWFGIDAGKSKTIRFLQEVDYEAEGYNEDADVGALVLIHNPPGPDGFKYKYLVPDDLLDEVPDWQPKQRLYINVLCDGEVMLWDTSKRTARSILNNSAEYGGLTNRPWKVVREGSGTDTQYLLMAKDKDGGIDVTEYLEDIVRPEDILIELTPERLARQASGGNADDGVTGDASDWTT